MSADVQAAGLGASARRGGMGRPYVVTVASSASALIFGLFTGVLSARLLGPEGRGILGAITAWVLVASTVGSLGFKDGLSYLESRDHRRAPSTLALGIVATVVLSSISIVLVELLIPFGFRAQSEEAIRHARIFMLWIVPFMASNTFTALLGARQRFLGVAAMRAGQPFLYALGLSALWVFGRGSLFEVLALQAGTFVVAAVLAFLALARESGLSAPDPQLGRDSWAWGIRSFGSSLGTLTNSRLDQMILPAVVLAEEIGLYVVAVRGASMIVGLFGSLSLVLFPTAARAGGRAAVEMAQRAIRLVFALSLVCALALFIVADPAVRLLYGTEFHGSVVPLRLLLPGVVFWATSQIVTGALKGMGHPVPGSVAQFVGVGVTIVGLAMTLPALGIAGAAITSSVSYCVVFAVGLLQFCRISQTKVSDTLSPSLVRRELAGAWDLVRRRGWRLAPDAVDHVGGN